MSKIFSSFSILFVVSHSLSVLSHPPSLSLPLSLSPSPSPSLYFYLQVVFDTATGIFESLAACGALNSDAIIKVQHSAI
jgi:hypothetical protein